MANLIVEEWREVLDECERESRVWDLPEILEVIPLVESFFIQRKRVGDLDSLIKFLLGAVEIWEKLHYTLRRVFLHQSLDIISRIKGGKILKYKLAKAAYPEDLVARDRWLELSRLP